jgi:hypothetical protein
MLPDTGAVLGIDVGYSELRPTTCLCLLEWTEDYVQLSLPCAVATDIQARSKALESLFPRPRRLAAVALDGPLTHGLRRISKYRLAEALLSRGVFQRRGKPGATNSPVGRQLHLHATQLAELLLEQGA